MSEDLIPFDLERALAGDPVVTRNGKTVTNLQTVSILRGYVHSSQYGWETNGSYFLSGTESTNDLFMAPKIHKVWLVIKEDYAPFWAYKNRDDAERLVKSQENIMKLKVVPTEYKA